MRSAGREPDRRRRILGQDLSCGDEIDESMQWRRLEGRRLVADWTWVGLPPVRAQSASAAAPSSSRKGS